MHTKLNIESVPDNTATLPRICKGMQLVRMYYYLYSTIGYRNFPYTSRCTQKWPFSLNHCQTKQQTQLKITPAQCYNQSINRLLDGRVSFLMSV